MMRSITQHMKRKALLTSLVLFGSAAFSTLAVPSLAQAAQSAPAVAMADKVQSGTFEKSSFTINGDWQIVRENGQMIFRLSDDFKTKNGPDLKLFISPKPVEDLNGITATTDAVRLAVLRSTKGAQEYVIPAGVDLSQFGSILIHCEAFSKLWGGANI